MSLCFLIRWMVTCWSVLYILRVWHADRQLETFKMFFFCGGLTALSISKIKSGQEGVLFTVLLQYALHVLGQSSQKGTEGKGGCEDQGGPFSCCVFFCLRGMIHWPCRRRLSVHPWPGRRGFQKAKECLRGCACRARASRWANKAVNLQYVHAGSCIKLCG